jgi:hypothetical protein
MDADEFATREAEVVALTPDTHEGEAPVEMK